MIAGGIYDERGVVKGEVLVVDWSIVAAFVKLLRAALPNPIQFSIVRAKLRFLGCGVDVWLVRFLALGFWNKELHERVRARQSPKGMEQHTNPNATL